MTDNTEEKTEAVDNTEAKAPEQEVAKEEVKEPVATEETKAEAPAEEAAPAPEEPSSAEATEGQATEEKTEEVKEEEVVAPEVEVRPGYTVKLHLRINDGKKERIQIFEGIVLKVSGKTPETRTITVRKSSKGFGVEKIVPLSMPALEKVEVVKTAKVRRATLGYLRNYKKRLREKIVR